MNETRATRIAAVQPNGDYTLCLRWAGGAMTIVDLREVVFGLKELRPLRDRAAFARVAVGEGGHLAAWRGGQDMSADRLWEISLEQSGRADAAEFLRWRRRHGLSLGAVAEALGLSHRRVAGYASGERAVPRTVLLACKGWELEQQQAA